MERERQELRGDGVSEEREVGPGRQVPWELKEGCAGFREVAVLPLTLHLT